MTGVPLTAVPVLATVDWAMLPLDATEGFVLSRVDGTSSVQTLCAVTGLPESQCVAIIEKLLALRALTLAPEEGAKPEGAPSAQDGELSGELQQKIDEKQALLGRGELYAVFGLEPRANAAEVKAAYYAFCKDFHPDRHFGKNLGAYNERLAELFKSGKHAYEVLSDPEQRRKHDATLAAKAPVMTATPVDEKETARHWALERRRQEIVEERQTQKLKPLAARRSQAAEFVEEAERILRRGDLVGAWNKYALALTFEPHNQEWKKRHDDLLPLASEERAKKCAVQAEAEASAGNFHGAAKHYEQAAAVKPGNGAYAHVSAEYYLRHGQDLEAGLRLAEAAVARGQRNAQYRLTLALILEKRGDRQRAREEAESAAELGSHAKELKSLLKRLRA